MKRKFKILIMAISVIAMLCVFAISSSAQDFSNVNSEGFEFYSSDYTQALCAPSVSEIIIPFGDNENLYICTLRGIRCGLIIDSFALQKICFLHDVSNRTEFVNFLREYRSLTPEGEYVYPNMTQEISLEIEAFLDYSDITSSEYDDLFMAALNHTEISSSDLGNKYNEGKLAGVEEYKSSDEYINSINSAISSGVEEYKSSDEYTTALNNKYSAGYTEGIEAFKVSKAYTDALDLQYSNGKVAGVTEFKNSVSFANTLKAEYEEGYDAGVLDTQGVNTKNETTKLISILIGVIGFGILFTAVLSAVGAFKKKAAKRR